MTRRKKKRAASFLKFVLTIIIVVFVVYFVYKKIPFKTNRTMDIIEGYNYAIENRDSTIMKENFESLKEVLSSSEIDYEKYAELISKLFIIDLYTLSNKENKYDIGGFEYVYPENVSNYKLKVQDTLYKYIESKDKRKQKLPTVSSIKLEDIKQATYEYQEKEYEAYDLTLSWEYKEDYGYDTKANLILMKDNNFLYVVEFSTEVES